MILEGSKALVTIRSRNNIKTHSTQCVLENTADRLIIIDHEGAAAAHGCIGSFLSHIGSGYGAVRKGQEDFDRRTLVWLGVDLDRSLVSADNS